MGCGYGIIQSKKLWSFLGFGGKIFIKKRWGCSPGRYQLKFDAEETCYLLKGKVKVYPKGSSETVEFGAGDLVTIPKGLSCTWDVSVAVDKYYKFESSSSSSPSQPPPSSSSSS